MSSETKRGLPSSFVAPMNCSKHGWRHREAMFISRSNNLLLWGDRIISWICLTATTQPRYFPSTTLPQAPLPRHLSVSWIWSRDMIHSGACWRGFSFKICWVVERDISSSFTSWSLILNCLSKAVTWFCKLFASWSLCCNCPWTSASCCDISLNCLCACSSRCAFSLRRFVIFASFSSSCAWKCVRCWPSSSLFTLSCCSAVISRLTIFSSLVGALLGRRTSSKLNHEFPICCDWVSGQEVRMCSIVNQEPKCARSKWLRAKLVFFGFVLFCFVTIVW